MIRRHLLAALPALAMASPAPAAETLSIAAGESTGVYAQFGREIGNTASTVDIDLLIEHSAGPVETLMAVRFTPGVQLGIVQSDAPTYLRQLAARGDIDAAAAEDLMARVKLVMPLHMEEVHLLARNGIYTLADLTGQRVAIGLPDSGTAMTAATILSLAGIVPAAVETIGGEAALAALKAGQVDAMFAIAGQPVELFEQNVALDDGLGFVQIDDPVVLANGYQETTVLRSNYPWSALDTPTVGIRAALVSYDYQRENCGLIAALSKQLRADLASLRDYGHAKWAVVDPDASVPDWQAYECAGDRAEGVLPLPEDTTTAVQPATAHTAPAQPEPAQENTGGGFNSLFSD